MEDNLKQLLKEEKEYRSKKDNHECYLTCLKILDEIQTQPENIKFEIISKLFLYPNQSNYVKLNLINSLLKNFSFINSKSSKRKYYELLINSFSKGKDKQYNQEISQIKKLYEKNELKNFIELDKYISNIIYEIINKSTSTQNSSNYMNSSINAETSLAHLAFKTSFLNEDTKQQNSFDDFSLDKNTDLISTTQESLSEEYNLNNRKKTSEIKINSNQFLDLINENFEKFNYHNICTIKDTEKDNIRVYEYQSKNCLHNLISKICKSDKNINKLQVLSILKRDENNFDTGINYLLNDTYERKISIKTIKGNPLNSIKIIVKFLRNFCVHIEKIKIIKQSKCFLRYNLESDLKNVISIHKNRIYKGQPSMIM